VTRSAGWMGAQDHAGSGPRDDTVDREGIEARVHVDLPRVRPEDMVTTQDVDPPHDPMGGRDTETEFMLRNAGW
jgi:hypothetical protein